MDKYSGDKEIDEVSFGTLPYVVDIGVTRDISAVESDVDVNIFGDIFVS